MVNITIDNHTIAVPSGTTIMEAAASIHIPIPKLCYLKDINEIGACRVCVVAVSYTHLDVYKRQFVCCAVIMYPSRFP